MILIENDIVFLSVPKNASISVHFALEESEFEIEPTFYHDLLLNDIIENNPILFKDRNHKIKVHPHISTVDVYSYLGKKIPTIFIKRDFSERFVSAINFILNSRITLAYPELFDTLEYIDNNWIYKTIDDNIVNDIIRFEQKSIENINTQIINSLKNLTKNKVFTNKNKKGKNLYINFKMLDSQEIYKSGYTPKYTFDINELDKLENLLYEKYGKKLEIKKLNVLNKNNIKTNIVNDNKLRSWVWDKFEKQHFTKKIF